MTDTARTTDTERPLVNGRLLECSVVYFFLSLINLRVKLSLTRGWFNGALEGNHERLLAFEYTNNEQSRLAQFAIPEIIQQLTGCEITTAYIVQRWVFVLLAFICFHLYLRKWFDEALCFTSVVCLSAVMPLTYFNHLQESAAFLMLTFLLILWAIRDDRTSAYSSLLLVGAVNNETVLVLPAVYFFYHWQGFRLSSVIRLFAMTLATAAPAYIYTFAIRYITRHNAHLGDPFQLPRNLAGIASDASLLPVDFWRAHYLFFIFVFGAFWFYAVFDYGRKPLFLRRAALMIPLFIAGHLITGRIDEPRQMIPLAYIILPMALMSLFPQTLPQSHKTA